MPTQSPNTPQEPNYLTTVQAASRMGIPIKDVRGLCKKGEKDGLTGAIKDGQNRWRIPVNSVEMWLQAQKINPASTAMHVPLVASQSSIHRRKIGKIILAVMAFFSATILFLASLFGSLADSLTVLDRVWPTILLSLTVHRAKENETLILVSDFYLAKNIPDSEPHKRISDMIATVANDLKIPNFSVKVLPLELQYNERERAKTLGEKYNASMIIWGEETSTQINANFLDLKNPDMPSSTVNIIEAERTYIHSILEPGPYTEFLNIELPTHLSFLALFAIGKSLYINGNFMLAVAPQLIVKVGKIG